MGYDCIFCSALIKFRYDRDWKKLESHIGSKTVIQVLFLFLWTEMKIRSHAQKYFLKVQKSGTGERIPPPRAKRKPGEGKPNDIFVSKSVPEVPIGCHLTMLTFYSTFINYNRRSFSFRQLDPRRNYSWRFSHVPHGSHTRSPHKTTRTI
jgi:hypothetical protein